MHVFRSFLTSRAWRLLFFGLVSHAHGQIATQPPEALIGTAGSGITIAASAPAATSCQWEKSTDGGNSYSTISGNASAATALLTLSNLQATDAARYRLVTPGGTSSATALSVISAARKNFIPQINFAFRAPGTSASVSGAAAIGSGSSVWNNLTGAALSTSATSQDLLADAVLVSDSGIATGATLTLTAASPTNTINGVVKSYSDSSGFGPVSSVMSYYTYYWWNSTVTLTIEGLRPGASYVLYGYGAGNATGQGSLWTLSASNGGSFASVLADFNNGYSRDVTNTANLGHSYVALTGEADASGGLSVVVDNGPGNNDPFFNGFQLVEAPQGTIVTQPSDTVTTVGGSATLFVSAPEATAFLWQRSIDGGSMYVDLDASINPSAASSQLVISNAQASDAALYRLIVLDEEGDVFISQAASLSVVPDAGSTPDSSVNVAFRASSQSGAPSVSGAGAVGTAGSAWNHLIGAVPSGTDRVQSLVSNAALVSDSGAATAKTVTLVASIKEWNMSAALKTGSNSSAFAPVSPILSYYTYLWWPGAYTVTLTGLKPEGVYELYGYGSGGGHLNGSKWTLGGTSADVLADFNNGYTRDVGNPSNLGHAYVKLSGAASGAGTLTFTIKSPSSGGDPFFNGFQVVPVALPSIITQPPSSASATIGGNFSLAVVASGQAPLSYQWQRSTDGGATFSNINAAANASAATASLTLASVQSGDAGIYRVLVSDSSGTAVSSSTTVTTSNDLVAPGIAGQPSATAVLYGDDAALTVAASGTSPLSYQWQHSTDGGSSYVNVGTDSFILTITGATFAHAGLYRVTITNSLGSATSDPVMLTVNRAPVITAQPSGGIHASGSTRTLSVGISAYPDPSYQWQHSSDGVAFTTVGTAADLPLTLSAATTGIYRVIVTNAIGSITSDKVFLGVATSQGFTFGPVPGATGVNPDAPLVIRFPASPRVGSVGKITVRKSADDSVVETIDLGAMASVANGSTTYRYQNKNVGGAGGGSYNYFPVVIVGNEARITLKSGTVLQYGTSYHVKIEPGVILDSTGASLPEISNASTWSFTTKVSAPPSVPVQTTFRVAADGSGDFATLQGALDFIPAGNTTPVRIDLRNGIYEEIINYGNRHKITLVGESRDQTVVEYVNNNVLNAGTSGRVSFFSKGNDLAIANLTINNATPKGGSQAEALRSDGTRNVFLGCAIKSFQDTLLLGAGNYFKDCLIQGDADYIWGGGTAMFKDCELRSMNPGELTQARTPSNRFGFVFVDCTLTRPAGTAWISGLGRTSADATTFGNAVFIDCRMDNHISATGWSSAFIHASYPANARNWEYHSRNLAGTALLDVGQRANSRQLSDAEAAVLRNAANVFGTTSNGTPAGAQGDGWVPSLAAVVLEQWAAAHGLDPAGNGAGAADADADGIINLVEFAFGMDPVSGRVGSSTSDGAMLLTTGMPSVHRGPGFVARFIRRKTDVADALIYTPQFSAGLAGWEDSTATPHVIASNSGFELVEVPYPASTGGEAPRFFRVLVSVGL